MAELEEFMWGFPIPRPTGLQSRALWDTGRQYMLEDLARSGLEPKDVLSYPMTLNLPQKACAGYVIPYYGRDGKVLASDRAGITAQMHRQRVFYPPNISVADLRRLPKYMQPSRDSIGEEAAKPYLHPSWKRGGDTLYIVEGEKKTAAVAKQLGVAAIGIGGCHNWHHPNPQVAAEGEVHPDIVFVASQFRRVVVIPDGDVLRWDIQRAYRGLVSGLQALGHEVEIVNFGALTPAKVDDWLVAHPEVRQVPSDWPLVDLSNMAENQAELIRRYNLLTRPATQNAPPRIIPHEANTYALIKEHPTFKGQFRINLDDMSMGNEFNEASTYFDVTCHFQRTFGIPDIKLTTVKNAVNAVAWANAYSARKEWLDGLVWDKKERLNGWMVKYLHAQDEEFVYEVGAKALIAAVARVFEPGCRVDFMTILKGPQGVGKSGAIKLLFGAENTLEYTRGGIDGKDALMAWRRYWCVSDEELGSISNAERNKLKGIITTQKDEFRAPYAAESKVHPRRFVYWGSTNDDEFLQADSSGQRRYAIVEMSGKKVDFEGLAAVREQLWAEAVHWYKFGNVDFSTVEGASERAEQYVSHGYMYDATVSYMENYKGPHPTCQHKGKACFYVTTLGIATSMGYHQPAQWQMREIVAALKALGWEYVKQKTIGGVHHNGVSVKIRDTVSRGSV